MKGKNMADVIESLGCRLTRGEDSLEEKDRKVASAMIKEFTGCSIYMQEINRQ